MAAPDNRQKRLPMKQAQIENELMQIVEESHLRAGGQLPPERDLCERLGVSRGTLRKVLNVLEARGVVRRHVGRGTFAIKPQFVGASSLVDIADATSPWELMELRLMIEPQIARLAAMRASQTEINYMRHCVAKSSEAEDQETYETWDMTLHRTVAEAAHNRLVLSVFEPVNELRKLTVWGQLRRIIVSPPGMIQHWCSQHRAFVDAIADRDPKAAEEKARFHVEEVFRSMRDGVANHPLEQSPPPTGGLADQ